MPRGASYYDAIEPWLLDVAQPVQYIGGEPNAVVKEWGAAAVHWALCYPDAYAIGQSNLGLAILYEVLNEQDWILAERTYSVRPDMAAAMRAHGVPQLTLEQHRAVADFDVLGINLSNELVYTNVLELLTLAGIPLHSSDRDDTQPLVVAGGHCACNPEPMADFLDVAVLGDGEGASLQLSAIVRTWLDLGRPGGRDGVLMELAKTGQFYVPRFYDVTYNADATIAGVHPNRAGVPARVKKHVLTDLDRWPYPKRPIVPIAETVHDRYSVEIFRGCTRGCRFCQAGMITRPVRERSVETIEAMAVNGLATTGYDEVSVLSLSSTDHTQIGQIAESLAARFQGGATSLSLPSSRVDSFNVQLAQELARNGRRTGLTFAPEGGTARLRDVINKNVSEEDLLATVAAAFEAGWRSVKLYFMCGLPTETDEDVLAIATLAHNVILKGREISGHRDIACTVSIGPFVPKPDTPFQWASQIDAETVDARLAALRQAIRDDRQCGRAITMRYGEGKAAQLEGLLSRGDRRVGNVIEAVWRAGQIFDGWHESANLPLWRETADDVLARFGVSMDWYTARERARTEVLPWDHLDVGLARGWLWREYRSAMKAATLPDCRGPLVTQHDPSTVDLAAPHPLLTVDLVTPNTACRDQNPGTTRQSADGWGQSCTLCGVCTALGVDLELAADPAFDSGRPVARAPRGARLASEQGGTTRTDIGDAHA